MEVEQRAYLDKPPVSDCDGFGYPDFEWPPQIWGKRVVAHDGSHEPEAVFIAQLGLPSPLPPADVYVFGFKVPLRGVMTFDDGYESDGWVRIYCIKEYRRDVKQWRDLFLHQYHDHDGCPGIFDRRYGSGIREYPDYDELKDKSRYNLSGKKVYWGPHPAKLWPTSPDGLLFLVAQVKEKRRKFERDIYPGGMRFLLFAGLVSGEIDYAIYFTH